jgi:hypothetical protein
MVRLLAGLTDEVVHDMHGVSFVSSETPVWI